MKEDPTILKVHRDPKGYAPEGSSIAFYDQFMITEDSVQVVELRIVGIPESAGRLQVANYVHRII